MRHLQAYGITLNDALDFLQQRQISAAFDEFRAERKNNGLLADIDLDDRSNLLPYAVLTEIDLIMGKFVFVYQHMA